ncbi:MAG: type II secretion system F family protein [Actinomycetota bacterium]|nr:type II secretion system F family protein [Actinomycetota bacterium]
MPEFRYKAFAEAGRLTSGTISADSERQAALKLKDLGIYPSELAPEKPPTKKIDPSGLPGLTRELSLLISSGVPVVEALRTAAGESGRGWKWLLDKLAEDVSGGMGLSKALEQYPVFPTFYCRMVASGEASGTLEDVLASLADFLDEDAKTRSRVKSALLYPAFMACVGAVVLVFIFAFVMPRITGIFKDSGQALPITTTILIFMSDFFMHYWWLLLGLAIGMGYALKNWLKKNRLKADEVLLKIGILRSLYLSRFTRAFGFLLAGGLPVVKALDLAGPSSGNAAIEEKTNDARRRLQEGADLAQALQAFPPVLVKLMNTGQKSGNLPAAVRKAAVSYEEDFKRKLERSLALLEPAMILMMGVIVGFVVFSVLLPIFEMNQLIK